MPSDPRALRVGFELTVCELDRGGTARAARSLHQALIKRNDLDVASLAQPGTARPRRGGRIARGLARELTWLPARLPLESRRLALDVLHCPAPAAPLWSPAPLVVTVFDALPWRHPKWLTRANVASHRLLVRPAVRRAAAVITASEHARREISQVYGIEPERIHVVSLGVDEQFSAGPCLEEALVRRGAQRPFVLTVGTLQPRKNLEAALSAFERVAAGWPELTLVVAGGGGWSERETKERIARSPVNSRIVLTGHVGDRELAALYRAADCFVFPSRYEGFGLPVLEAMASGTPVVCSDCTSLPEVAGGAAILVPPGGIDEIAEAIHQIASSESLRRDLIDRGLARAASFTWERCAERTVAVYHAAIASGR